MERELVFRLATKDDLLDIVRMLSDDTLGVSREKIEEAISDNYLKAFEKIQVDPNHELTVAERIEGSNRSSKNKCEIPRAGNRNQSV
jgi:hypothetical protein